jgi:hypothetical protein
MTNLDVFLRFLALEVPVVVVVWLLAAVIELRARVARLERRMDR